MVRARANIRRLGRYHPPLEGRGDYDLRLDFNESLRCAPKEVIRDVIDYVKKERLNVYPEYGDLEGRVAGFFGVRRGQAMLTNGSDQGIDLMFRTYVDPGDEVIIPSPSFAMFYQWAGVAGAKVKRVSYGGDMSFPAEKVLKSIGKKTRMIILCNPNNPTGTPINPVDIERILKKAGGKAVLVDEAYYEFNGETVLPLLEDYDNLFVARTFSKSFGLSALRIGCLLTSRGNMADLLKVRGPYDISMISKAAVSSAIRNIEPVREYCREVVEKSRPYLLSELERLGVKYYPTSANFVLVRFRGDSGDIAGALKKKGILVRPQSGHPLLRNTVRITIADLKSTRELVRALRQIL
jgi:histidinol-phosphate aminotransferase